jgi:hypothetical protein
MSIADAVAKPMTDFPHTVQPGDKPIPAVGRQCVCDLEGLLKHAHQCIKISFLFVADVATEPGSRRKSGAT